MAIAYKMQKKMPHQKELPDKLYFKIGEVSDIAGLPPYVLRFWESEFKMIRPQRTASGQRQYKKTDVELILTIKHLLHDKKFTIQGARRHLRYLNKGEKDISIADTINEIRTELESIRNILG